MTVVNLAQKFSLIHEHWRPKVAATLNGQEVKIVKFEGTFPWHSHLESDEMFLVFKGQMKVEYRNEVVSLKAGELHVVPRGVEHRTVADTEAEVVIFEAAEVRNTGALVDAQFTAPNGVHI